MKCTCERKLLGMTLNVRATTISNTGTTKFYFKPAESPYNDHIKVEPGESVTVCDMCKRVIKEE